MLDVLLDVPTDVRVDTVLLLVENPVALATELLVVATSRHPAMRRSNGERRKKHDTRGIVIRHNAEPS